MIKNEYQFTKGHNIFYIGWAGALLFKFNTKQERLDFYEEYCLLWLTKSKNAL